MLKPVYGIGPRFDLLTSDEGGRQPLSHHDLYLLPPNTAGPGTLARLHTTNQPHLVNITAKNSH